jgi:hypothetical protein
MGNECIYQSYLGCNIDPEHLAAATSGLGQMNISHKNFKTCAQKGVS